MIYRLVGADADAAVIRKYTRNLMAEKQMDDMQIGDLAFSMHEPRCLNLIDLGSGPIDLLELAPPA